MSNSSSPTTVASDPIFGTSFSDTLPAPYPTAVLVSGLTALLSLVLFCTLAVRANRRRAKVTGTAANRKSRGLKGSTWDAKYVRDVVDEAFENQGSYRIADTIGQDKLQAVLTDCIGRPPSGDEQSGFEAACTSAAGGGSGYTRANCVDAILATNQTHLAGCAVRTKKDQLFVKNHKVDSPMKWLRAMRWSVRLFTACNILLFPISILVATTSIATISKSSYYPEAYGLAVGSCIVFVLSMLGLYAMWRLHDDLMRDDDGKETVAPQ